jgi:prepilin peptidase CpaA
MNLVVLSPLWLAWLLAGLLIAAAVQDAVKLRISNFLVLGVIAGAIVAMILAGLDLALWQNFAVFAGLLVIGTPLFAAGKMGGGDVKLLAATGLWFDLRGALMMIASVFIAGGILALLIIVARLFGWSERTRERIHILQKAGGIPYGVAISAGALVAAWVMRG